MPETQAPEQLLRDNLDRLERIVAALCRRHHLSGDEADDFASFTHLRLCENDYAVLRKFRGESSLPTYLTVVVAMLFREYCVRERGRWRPSAAARRLGPDAVRLETLLYRDGCSLSHAHASLRGAGTDLSDREFATMVSKLPPRYAPRPRRVAAETLDGLPSAAGAEDVVLSMEAEQERRRMEEALLRAVDALPPEDRTIVRMRIWEGLSVADISRALDLPQKPLYRRLERIVATLGEAVRAAGVTRTQVRALLDDAD
ncbi:MAG TPA: sigma-70 family RNA polymerase sigma factor [Longimicrobium sp.]|nr:sigma-70 family RNA polymerase sigma factor [Longimicrobium sp.]